ncbi:MAG: hypothetical protein ACI9XO_000763 [Paraglaciecola sp.]
MLCLPILTGEISMRDKLKYQKYYYSIAINILLMAILLRIIGFVRATPFFLDELNVARNIAEKSYVDLLLPLKYDQFLPPFFAQMVKGSAHVFGYTELGLRFIPFITGVGSLILFYALLRRLFNSVLLLYPLVLFLFNFYLYQQGLSLKQYSMDVLLGIFWLFIAVKIPNPRGRQFVYFGILGIISIWFSMSVVFVLSGVGCYFLFRRWKEGDFYLKKSINILKKNLPLFLMIGMWLTSFAILFWVNLRHGVQDDIQQQYHSPFFLQTPTSLAGIQQSYRIFIGVFRAIVGQTAIALGWAILCFVLGVFHVFKKEKSLLILLLVPILSCFFASLLHYYSLMIRLTLFLIPSLLILMSFGVAFIVEKIDFNIGKKRLIVLPVLLFLIIFSTIHRNALPYFLKENVRGNGRLVLEKIANTKERELSLYATNFGIPGYEFYTKYYERSIEIPSKNVFYAQWKDDLTVLAKVWRGEGIERIWIFDTHTFGHEKVKMERDIQQIGIVEIHFKEINADAFLIKLK